MPPLECWRGTRPSQAANCRPEWNTEASGTEASGTLAASEAERGARKADEEAAVREIAALEPALDRALALPDVVARPAALKEVRAAGGIAGMLAACFGRHA